MIDIGFNGPKYTWTNNRNGLNNIKERIDRGVANTHWLNLFPNATIKHLPICSSDHSPIVLDTLGRNYQKRSFKLEEFWTRDPTSQMIVQKAWNTQIDGTPGYILSKKLKEVKKALKSWNINHFGNIQTSIKNRNQALIQIQNTNPTAHSMISASIIKDQLNK